MAKNIYMWDLIAIAFFEFLMNNKCVFGVVPNDVVPVARGSSVATDRHCLAMRRCLSVVVGQSLLVSRR